jgi:hypothetical protein
MSKSDIKTGSNPPKTMLIFGQKKTNSSCTENTDFPPSNRTAEQNDSLSKTVVLLEKEVGILKSKLVAYEETFQQIFDMFTSNDRRLISLEDMIKLHHGEFGLRYRRCNTSVEEIEHPNHFNQYTSNSYIPS